MITSEALPPDTLMSCGARGHMPVLLSCEHCLSQSSRARLTDSVARGQEVAGRRGSFTASGGCTAQRIALQVRHPTVSFICDFVAIVQNDRTFQFLAPGPLLPSHWMFHIRHCSVGQAETAFFTGPTTSHPRWSRLLPERAAPTHSRTALS